MYRIALVCLGALAPLTAHAQDPVADHIVDPSECEGDDPTVHCSIQTAIDAATAGQTILVMPGEYVESLYIGKDLTILSAAGAAETMLRAGRDAPQVAQHQVEGDAVVTIDAEEVTFGRVDGETNHGFTVSAFEGSTAIRVVGSSVIDDTVVIEGNRIQGCEALAGVLVDPRLDGGHLVVRNNTFEKGCDGEADFSFEDAIHFASDAPDYLSANNATVELLENIITDFDRTAVLFGAVHGSTITITPSTFKGVENSRTWCGNAGVAFFGGIHDGSNVTIDDTRIESVMSGVIVFGDVDGGSTLDMDGVVIDAFRFAAVMLTGETFCAPTGVAGNGAVRGAESAVRIAGGRFTGADEPISFPFGNSIGGVGIEGGVRDGAALAVNATHIAAFHEIGIFTGPVEGNASSMSITGTTLQGAGAAEGIRVGNISDGAAVTINGNLIRGVASDGGNGIALPEGVAATEVEDSGAAIRLETIQDASTVEVCHNMLTAHEDRPAPFGIWFATPPREASSLTVCNNSVSGFAGASLWFDRSSFSEESGPNFLEITGNRLMGADYGISFHGSSLARLDARLAQNAITGFTGTGIFFLNEISDSSVRIDNNQITGGGNEAGIDFSGTIASAEVGIRENCVANVPVGLRIRDVDGADVRAEQNDLAGTGIGIAGPDEGDVVNAANNWWGSPDAPGTGDSVGVSGNVAFDPVLTAAPDLDGDGDGVSDCDDACPGTADGQDVDADGCACAQRNPAPDLDGDGVPLACDNCPGLPNPDQADTDGDGIGDACSPAGPGGPGGGGSNQDPRFFIGFTDDDGFVEGTVSDGLGQILGQVVVSGATSNELVAMGATDAPDGDGTTFAGFADGLDLGRRLTLETSAAPGTFTVIVSMTFTLDELAELGLLPADVEISVLDQTQTPPVWIPAGVNTGEGPPSGVPGESGFTVNADGTVTYWVVRDRLSVFAVGSIPAAEPSATGEPSPGPAETPTPATTTTTTTSDVQDDTDPFVSPLCALCGVGCGQMLLMSLLGLVVLQGTQRRRTL